MPYFEINCEVCGKYSREWRSDKPHRFCSQACQKTGMVGQRIKPVKYTIDHRHYDRIKQVYLSGTGQGQVTALAKLIGIPRWKITRFAISQGWVQKAVKSKAWSPEEEAMLQNLSRYCIDKIAQKMRNAGYPRTPTAIAMRMRRKRTRSNLKGYSAHQVSECLGIDSKGVTRLITQKKLVADRRGTARTEQQGGDMWYIKPKELRDYVINYISEIDFRKIDRYWLVDILIGERSSGMDMG